MAEMALDGGLAMREIEECDVIFKCHLSTMLKKMSEAFHRGKVKNETKLDLGKGFAKKHASKVFK